MNNNNNITTKRATFDKYLAKHRLHDAISLLRGLAEKHMAWEISDEVNKVDSSYSYLLKYAIEGSDDPSRKDIYASLVASLSEAYDRLERAAKSKEAYSAYYSTVRGCQGKTIGSVASSYFKTLNASNDFAAAMGQSASPADIEGMETQLFNIVWTAFPLRKDDASALRDLFASPAVPADTKRLLASALMLGSLEYHDPMRYTLLADLYAESGRSQLSLEALVALLISLNANRHRPLDLKSRSRLAALKDLPSWKSDIKTAFLELIRTRDTDRLTRKMTDEIVPEMMKMRPDLNKKIKNKNIEQLDITDLEENPEWQEMLDKSGIAEKMRELSEIQEEGGDVMMGTFAHLKSFPFFNTVANWFLPFRDNHSVVDAGTDGFDIIGGLLDKAPFMCDSDKYSFVLALKSVPAQQRELMSSQLKQHNISAAEIKSAELNLSTDTTRNTINKYVQNLYRFFNLFRRKEEFKNPFAEQINLTEVPLLRDEFADDDTLNLVAEFYFRHKYYKEALEVFSLIESRAVNPDAPLLQKIGYCEQQLGNLREAIGYYRKAELLDAANLWTIRRLASCYRLAGDYANALEYYRAIDLADPENIQAATHLGICQLNLGDYAAAVKSFVKANYLDGGKTKTLRLLAWAQLLNRQFESAAASYQKLLDDESTIAEDFLNAGHLEMVRKNYPKAVDDYAVFVRMSGDNFTSFINSMRSDTSSIIDAGADADMIPLVIDAVAYRVK